MKKLILLAGTLCLGSAPAMAANAGLYFDVELGLSTFHDINKNDFDAALTSQGASIQDSSFDDQGSPWSAAVGYRVSRYFAADLSYIDLGAAKYRANVTSGGIPLLYKASLSAGGPAVAAMGILPLGTRFELRGRAGILFTQGVIKEYATDSLSSLSTASDAKSHDLFIGIGAAFKVTDTFAVHVGAQRFNKVGDKNTMEDLDLQEVNVDVFSLGVTFSQ